jgi:endoglucanase
MDIDQVQKTLKTLSEVTGISGFEDKPRELIQQEIEQLVDKMWIDPIGNLLAIRKGTAKRPRILLDAHTDEIGFLVKFIDKNGFIRLSPIGGWDPRILPGQRVVFQSNQTKQVQPVYGVIGALPPHLTTAKQREKVIQIEDLFVDVGVTSREAVEKLGIRIGTPLTVWQPFIELPDGAFSGKAFDDRVGCTILIEVLRRLAEERNHSATVVFNFATSEEVGLRGARTGAYTLEPDVALAIECTSAGDLPGLAEHQSPTQLGQGPAITIADRSLITHPKVRDTLAKVAAAQNIPWQWKQPLIRGGTDGGAIALTRGGVPTGVVSVPCRYIHSAISLLQFSDVMATIDLVYGFIQTWKE